MRIPAPDAHDTAHNRKPFGGPPTLTWTLDPLALDLDVLSVCNPPKRQKRYLRTLLIGSSIALMG